MSGCESSFLDRLATQLKANESASCRRAVQRILALMKKDYEAADTGHRPKLKSSSGSG